MNQRANASGLWARANWFYIIAIAVILIDFSVVSFFELLTTKETEAVLLFDFVIVLPLLYLWCYRLLGFATLIRTVAMACFAVWILGHIIPPEDQNILSTYGWIRYIGIAGLVAVELRVIAFVWINVFSGNASKADVTDALFKVGTPLWLSKLIVTEALFWRRVRDSVKRFFGKQR